MQRIRQSIGHFLEEIGRRIAGEPRTIEDGYALRPEVDFGPEATPFDAGEWLDIHFSNDDIPEEREESRLWFERAERRYRIERALRGRPPSASIH